MIRPIGTETNLPSQELSHFTNRVDELTAYKRLLEIPHGQPIPLLMFYGVGGAGKSWLLKCFRQQTLTMPTVYIDLDPRLGGQSLGNNPSRALAKIRRQLGDDVKCPLFDLAYAWLRYKEGNSDEPLFKGPGKESVSSGCVCYADRRELTLRRQSLDSPRSLFSAT